MKTNILDSMALVTRAVEAELFGHGIAGLLLSDGAISIQDTSREWPSRSVSCTIGLQHEGIVQELRVDVDVDCGRMVGDHNPVIRAFVAGALAFHARHAALEAERVSLRDQVTTAINEAWLEDVAIELLAIRRQPLNMIDQDHTDRWQIDLLMLGIYEEKIVRDAIVVDVHPAKVGVMGDEIRDYWVPEQRQLMARLGLPQGIALG